jgi:acyl-CoA thioester hydrolase
MSADGVAGAPFSIQQRIYYQHTDAGGVVYHANYLSLMEAARTEFLHALGFDLARLAEHPGVFFVVRKASLAFRRPARLHELVRVTAWPASIGRARIGFDQAVFCGDERLVSATVELACVEPLHWRPVAVPDAVRDALRGLQDRAPATSMQLSES